MVPLALVILVPRIILLFITSLLIGLTSSVADAGISENRAPVAPFVFAGRAMSTACQGKINV